MNDMLLTRIYSAAKERRWGDLLEIGTKALEDQDLDNMTLVNIGIYMRDSAFFELADRIFAYLIDKDSGFRFSYYELGTSLILQGKSIESAELLRKYLDLWPDDERVIVLYIRALVLCGGLNEACNYINRVGFSPTFSRELAIQYEFGKYLGDHSRNNAELLVRKVGSRYPFRSVDDVSKFFLKSKKDRTPSSLIRLGDGEGSYIKINHVDEFTHSHLYADNRRQFREIWFGDALKNEEERFELTANELSSAITEADFVGLPTLSWIDHEYKIGSTRGVSCLVNIFRFISELKGINTIQQCSQSVHIDLGGTSFFDSLIGGENEIGLISCFSDLPAHLQSKFNIRNVRFFKIPGEQGFRSIIGDEAADGNHFPHIFQSLMAAIEREASGKVFLVAGGILGKLYVRNIKRAGGIAIDIGSLADAWVKKMTRPGYEKLDALALK